jgi:hypothetical protein
MDVDKKVQLPFLHLNGSGKKNLEEQYAEVWKKAYELRESFSKIVPHMRDFYPLPNAAEAYGRARAEFHEWYRLTDEILGAMTAMRLGISDGGHKIEEDR